MQSLLTAADAVDAALDALAEPQPSGPGMKHRAEAIRLLLESRAELAWAFDMWRVAYPETSAAMRPIDIGRFASAGRLAARPKPPQL